MVPTANDYKELQQTDRNLKVVDGSLIIKNIQKHHEGYYLCKASNGIGGISAVAKISVQGNKFSDKIRGIKPLKYLSLLQHLHHLKLRKEPKLP